ncbi:hypothetical protein K457DRAFT_799927 [Linnemannia elongata AG-77]|uniref:Uncharacterized protein n=1 Tax=Linnemannia elongata AG-77 TaxID=1314771 RepID=A0A197JI83_9FUNG|nr:hypothetical protein K457DRAFT_799927 [Linnemannia elongata AG-77]
MSTSSVDLDMDDSDDAVALVREPPSRISFPSYSGLLKPSATASAKRPTRGIPISMPTTQRRESNFSFFTSNAALVTGARESSSPKRPVFGAQMISRQPPRQRAQSINEGHSPAHSLGSLESRKKQKQAEVVLLSDEDDMKDPKTVKRKKHSQEVDSRSNGAHTAESKPGSIVSRMKKAAVPVVSDTLPSYMEVDSTPTPQSLYHAAILAASSKSERNSTSIKPELQSTKLGLPSTKSGLLATSPATPPTKPNAAPVKTTPTSTKYTQPPVKPATSSAKPASSATLPSSSTVKPAPFYLACLAFITRVIPQPDKDSQSGHAFALRKVRAAGYWFLSTSPSRKSARWDKDRHQTAKDGGSAWPGSIHHQH